MWKRTTALLGVGIASALAVAAASAQSPYSTDHIGFDLRNPLTAKRVHVNRTANGKESSSEFLEFVARDSEGRLRIEKRGTVKGPAGSTEEVMLNTREGETFNVSREMLGTVVLVFDWPGEKLISIQPGMRIARVTELRAQLSRPSPDRPFSYYYAAMLRRETIPNLSAEDLGYKEIEGFQARGIRITNLGTEKDGAWGGKPIRSDEMWLSDDLAAMVLRIHKDLKNGTEDREVLTNIKREEPEAALFEIPPGYTVNPTPGEMPFQKLENGKTVNRKN
jgi:hypothetical protein